MGAKIGHIVTKETREKLRKFNLGRMDSKEIRENVAKAIQKGYDEGTRKPYWLNKKQSGESNKKKSEKLKGKSYEQLFGKEEADKLKEIRRNQTKGQFVKGRETWNKNMPMRNTTREKLRKIGVEMWEDKEYRKSQISKILKGLIKRPTSYEKRVSELCIEFNLPFIYCGNGTFIIGGKNPDFKHNYLPIIIEVYNKFHHPDNYEEIRREHFSKYGYKVIFINQDEVLDKGYKDICLNKINEEVNK